MPSALEYAFACSTTVVLSYISSGIHQWRKHRKQVAHKIEAQKRKAQEVEAIARASEARHRQLQIEYSLLQKRMAKEREAKAQEKFLERKAQEREAQEKDLLKRPASRATAGCRCAVCMDIIPLGSIMFKQRGCKLVMCQDCTSEMCYTRARSSGSDGNSNAELTCKACTPNHSLAPSSLARTVPTFVFKELQAKLSREPVHGTWRAFMARDCPDCQNTAAVAAGLPFFMCTSVRCSSKQNLFCIFCNGPWASGHMCAAPIDIKTVEDMLRQEAAATDDLQLQNVLVRPCPRCPVRICTKDPGACYHMTCAQCDLQYCGVCQYIKNSDGWWSGNHNCVDSGNIYKRSEPRRRAVLSAYQEALA